MRATNTRSAAQRSAAQRAYHHASAVVLVVELLVGRHDALSEQVVVHSLPSGVTNHSHGNRAQQRQSRRSYTLTKRSFFLTSI